MHSNTKMSGPGGNREIQDLDKVEKLKPYVMNRSHWKGLKFALIC